jgi:hypothetical protein
MNLANTGEFAVTSSLNGYDFWKGNNEHTLDYFPHRSLDALSELAPEMAPGQSEWAWSAECIRQAIDFNLNHPRTAAALFAARVYQVFFAVTGEERSNGYPALALLKPLGVLYMIIFRLALLASIAHAGRIAWRFVRGQDRTTAIRESFEVAVGYLVFVAAFVTPYLIAWGTERRLMPLVIPAFLYLWFVAERGGIVTDEVIDKLREDDAY